MVGGDRSDWQMINGVVFSKNVSHRKDRRSIDDPRILLLSAPIEYQRIENKMSSLEPQILQVLVTCRLIDGLDWMLCTT